MSPGAKMKMKRPPRPERKVKAVVRVTPLAEKLQAPTKATPQDLFELAMNKWTAGERFDIGKMANELGVGRATVFRWVGSRELLYGEVLSRMFDFALEAAQQQAKGKGADYVADVSRLLMETLIAYEPLQNFVRQDPEYAMRVLMSKSSTVEQRTAAIVKKLLEEQIAAGNIRPTMKADDLAYLIVRIGESYVYREAITGDAPDIEPATTAIRILVA